MGIFQGFLQLVCMFLLPSYCSDQTQLEEEGCFYFCFFFNVSGSQSVMAGTRSQVLKQRSQGMLLTGFLSSTYSTCSGFCFCCCCCCFCCCCFIQPTGGTAHRVLLSLTSIINQGNACLQASQMEEVSQLWLLLSTWPGLGQVDIKLTRTEFVSSPFSETSYEIIPLPTQTLLFLFLLCICKYVLTRMFI